MNNNTNPHQQHRVKACPACREAVNHQMNHREWCDGGRRARPDERWICRQCGHTFAEPITRPSRRQHQLTRQ